MQTITIQTAKSGQQPPPSLDEYDDPNPRGFQLNESCKGLHQCRRSHPESCNAAHISCFTSPNSAAQDTKTDRASTRPIYSRRCPKGIVSLVRMMDALINLCLLYLNSLAAASDGDILKIWGRSGRRESRLLRLLMDSGRQVSLDQSSWYWAGYWARREREKSSILSAVGQWRNQADTGSWKSSRDESCV